MLSLPWVQDPRAFLESYRRPLMVLCGLMVLTTLIAVIGLAADPRMITGAPAWMKPLKFAISILIYAGTLWALLPAIADRPVLVRFVSWAVALGLFVEMVLIAFQAARGTTSHFNNTTELDATIFRIMGGTIIGVWILTMVVAALFFRRHLAHPALTWSVRLGFIGSILGMGVAVLMTFPTPDQVAAANSGLPFLVRGAHAVGVADGGPGLPIVGWSTTGGDLRIAHFVGLHALQAVPLFALILIGVSSPTLSPRVQTQLTVIVGLTWIVLTLLLMWQALRGQPVTAPDGLTVAWFLTIVLGAAGAAAVVLVRSKQISSTRIA